VPARLAFVDAIGGYGYHNASVYSVVGGRSVSIVGDGWRARYGYYLRRAVVTGDLEAMNMSHYQNRKNKAHLELPNHSRKQNCEK